MARRAAALSGGIPGRRLLRWLRHAPDRWLHPWRRRRAVGRLSRLTTEDARTILFLCHGNICRSPYAERALRARLAEHSGRSPGGQPGDGEALAGQPGHQRRSGGEAESGHRRTSGQAQKSAQEQKLAHPPQVRSAGFIGPGRPSPPLAREVAVERGVDLSSHRSRLITSEMLAEAGLIVVMAPVQARVLRGSHGVPDQRLLILGDLDPLRASTREIRDPFGQSREVFDSVFGRIDRCLTIAANLLGER